MKVVFHPDFARDQRKFQADYAEISAGLSARFRQEIDDAIEAIKASPSPDISHLARRCCHRVFEDLSRRRRRLDIRATDKTAWRFCSQPAFSAHPRLHPDRPRLAGRKNR